MAGVFSRSIAFKLDAGAHLIANHEAPTRAQLGDCEAKCRPKIGA
jgi:hypothetical protein